MDFILYDICALIGAFIRWIFLRKKKKYWEIVDEGSGNHLLGISFVTLILIITSLLFI
jgi:hypothetical protein